MKATIEETAAAGSEQLQPGRTLGPYRIMALLGAGGMGAVYRARDERLGRDVALKLLPDTVGDDPSRLRRFEQEARSLAALNHPGIVAVFDFDGRAETPYLVSELLEGEDLRRRSGRPLPWREAVDWALQIARALLAAHDRGIVHRDIKPENLFLTRDGRLKVLDFGIARADGRASTEELAETADPQSDPQHDPAIVAARAREALTRPGTVIGTAGYMAPEQLRAEPVDHRADLFAFGAVLYELLTGTRCFEGATAIERSAAALKVDPPPLPPSLRVPHELERLVRRCVHKDPARRYQSTRDLVIELEGIASEAATGPQATRSRSTWLPDRRVALLAALVLGVGAVGLVIGQRLRGTALLPSLTSEGAKPPRYHRVTFRRMAVGEARFSPDGRQIVFNAAVENGPEQVFVTTSDNPEGRALTDPDVGLFGLSRSGVMALRIPNPPNSMVPGWRLARAPLDGGAPREVLNNVKWADLSADSREMTLVRFINGRDRLEYPPTHELFDTQGFLGHPRISPDGGAVAFVHWPVRYEEHGSVEVAWRDGKKRTLSSGWSSVRGIAWSPDGREVIFAAGRPGEPRGIHAVTLDGREHLVDEGPGSLVVEDVAPDGRLLVNRDASRRAMFVHAPGDTVDRDLSWLDRPRLVDLSADGKRVLFVETGDGAQERAVAYVRELSGNRPAVRLGDGIAWALSGDGQWALMSPARGGPYTELLLVPTGPGEPRKLPAGNIAGYRQAAFLPDGKSIVIGGYHEGQRGQLWLQRLDGGDPTPFTEGGYGLGSGSPISPSGTRLVSTDPIGYLVLMPVGGGPVTRLPMGEDDFVIQWLDENRLLVRVGRTLPVHLVELDLTTGKTTPWRDIIPNDTGGEVRIVTLLVTRDRSTYAYALHQSLADVYLMERKP